MNDRLILDPVATTSELYGMDDNSKLFVSLFVSLTLLLWSVSAVLVR